MGRTTPGERATHFLRLIRSCGDGRPSDISSERPLAVLQLDREERDETVVWLMENDESRARLSSLPAGQHDLFLLWLPPPRPSTSATIYKQVMASLRLWARS